MPDIVKVLPKKKKEENDMILKELSNVIKTLNTEEAVNKQSKYT